MLRYILFLLLGNMIATAYAQESPKIEVDQTESLFIAHTKFKIKANPAIVHSVLTDFDHMPEFLGNLKTSKAIRSGNKQVKLTQTGITKLGPFSYEFYSERDIEISDSKIQSKQIRGTAKSFESTATLSADGDYTILEYVAKIDPGSILATMFGKAVIAQELEDQLKALSAEMLKRTVR